MEELIYKAVGGDHIRESLKAGGTLKSFNPHKKVYVIFNGVSIPIGKDSTVDQMICFYHESLSGTALGEGG